VAFPLIRVAVSGDPAAIREVQTAEKIGYQD
jgi:hypothetical protein